MPTQEVVLPPDILSPRRARRFVRDALEPQPGDDVGDVVALLVSEVVTNAVLHARSDLRLTVGCQGSQIRVEVADESPAPPTRSPFSEHAATGRGLQLLEALADSWGLQPQPRGKTVWFELTHTT